MGCLLCYNRNHFIGVVFARAACGWFGGATGAPVVACAHVVILTGVLNTLGFGWLAHLNYV